MAVPFPDPASDSEAPARLLAEAGARDNASAASGAPGAPAMTVSQLSAAIKRAVEDGFGRVRVRGELSGTKRAASGHFYACLKDDNALIDITATEIPILDGSAGSWPPCRTRPSWSRPAGARAHSTPLPTRVRSAAP